MEHSILFFGHHKGGTVWISRILGSICRRLGLKGGYVNSPKHFHFDLRSFSQNNGYDFICYTNADIQYIKQMGHFRGFHVIRDPRDIIVSAYFSHMNSHPTTNWPELVAHREILKRVPKEEGLELEMEFCKSLWTDGIELDVFGSMRRWDYSMENVKELKFEELVQRPADLYWQIFDFLGLAARTNTETQQRLTRTDIDEIIEKNSFTRHSGGRERGTENTMNHYRKGVPGDWKNHFSQTNTASFKAMFGDLLIDLAYETSSDW